jgi:hypothetical protein
MQQGSSANAGTAGASAPATLTDEQILGLEPEGPASGSSAVAQVFPAPPRHAGRDGGPEALSDAAGDENPPGPDKTRRGRPELQQSAGASEDPNYSNGEPRDQRAGDASAEPEWLKALDAQPAAAAEARRWRDAEREVAAIDADYFSAEPGARAGLATRLLENDPAAFRAMLADAARVLAERDPQGLAELARQLGGAHAGSSAGPSAKSVTHAAAPSVPGVILSEAKNLSDTGRTEAQRDSSGRGNGPQNDSVRANAFPADSYRQFASAANEAVEQQMREAIDRTLGATLPDAIADGARRRIGDDIFREVHTSLAADRELSTKVAELLRGWQFDPGTRQQLAALVTGRARAVLPEVARRVVSEWTSSVLASDRAKNARIESAASRHDITGGRLPEPIASSALRPRRVDYARTTDEQILEM